MAAVVEQTDSQVELGRAQRSVRRCTVLRDRRRRPATRKVGTAATLITLIGTALRPDLAKGGHGRSWWEIPCELYRPPSAAESDPRA